MDTLMEIPKDRYEAHIALSERLLTKGQERNFQWRPVYGAEPPMALIRKNDDFEDPELDEGSIVRFEIEMIPCKRKRGHTSRNFYGVGQRRDFIQNRLYTQAGLLVDNNSLAFEDTNGVILRKSNIFVKCSCLFTGTAEVMDIDMLINALKNGIGQGKAYGYGLLTVKEI